MQQILGAYEEERRRVAYDIHDGPAQRLVGAYMYLESFSAGRQHREDDEREGYLERAGFHLDAALRETRRIMADLRPAMLDDLGLAEALRMTLAEMADQTPVELDYTANGDGPRLDPPIEIALFHIAQEAVGNALKHAETPRIAVTVEIGETSASIHIRDWGKGFDVARAAGALPGGLRLGLAGMRERTELLGGSLSVESAAGEGTTIKVSVPVPPAVGASERVASIGETVGPDGA